MAAYAKALCKQNAKDVIWNSKDTVEKIHWKKDTRQINLYFLSAFVDKKEPSFDLLMFLFLLDEKTKQQKRYGQVDTNIR